MNEYLVKCQICSKKIGNNICKKCGKNVCEDHYDSSRGLCTACKQGKMFD